MSIQFDNISYKQICIFLDTIFEYSELDSIRLKYELSAENFKDTMIFLEFLKLVRLYNNTIKPTDEIYFYKDNPLSDDRLKELILCALFDCHRPPIKLLDEYLSQYNLSGNRLTSRPRVEHRVEKSGIRNILMELGLVTYEKELEQYTIPIEHSYSFVKYIENRQLSQEVLEEILRKQKVLGDLAEDAVVKYEKKRLSDKLGLSKRIRKISQEDACAGYDILSFESYLNENNIHEERFIEVKAVSIKDYSFYWSRNEIDKSIYYGNRYFLYLLPVLKMNQIDIDYLKIIQNPYVNVMNDSDWNHTVETYKFNLQKNKKIDPNID